MKTVESVTKYLEFTIEDKRLINQAMIHQVGEITLKSFLADDMKYSSDYMINLLSAYGKIFGFLPSDWHLHVRFTSDEKHCMCDVLRKEYKDESLDQEYRDKLLPILEGIFNN